MAHETATATSESVRHSISHSVNNTIWTKSARLRPTPIPADTVQPAPAISIPATIPATITGPKVTGHKHTATISIRASTMCVTRPSCGAWISISIRHGTKQPSLWQKKKKNNQIETIYIWMPYTLYMAPNRSNWRQIKNEMQEGQRVKCSKNYIHICQINEWSYLCETYYNLVIRTNYANLDTKTNTIMNYRTNIDICITNSTSTQLLFFWRIYSSPVFVCTISVNVETYLKNVTSYPYT